MNSCTCTSPISLTSGRFLPYRPRDSSELIASGFDDVPGVGPALRRRLAVIAERRVTFADNGADALVLGAVDEAPGVRRVAHESVEDRSERLRRGDAHVL